MFEEVRNENVLSMINEETKELSPSGRQCLKQIIEKYQDKEKNDKISTILNGIVDTKIEVKKILIKW